jgi:hypothetical protein
MDTAYTAIVVGTAILLVPETEEMLAYDNVINSVLYAQLVANKSVEKQPGSQWYECYTEVLDNFWVRQTRAREDRNVLSGNMESVIDWVVDCIGKADPDRVPAIAAMLDQCANLPAEHPAIHLLRTHMQKISDATAMPVQLLVIVAHSPTHLTSVFVTLRTHQALPVNPLAHAYQAEEVQGPVTLRFARSTLSQGLYEMVASEIALKIQDRIAANVAALSLEHEQ